MLFEPPALSDRDLSVVAEIDAMRTALRQDTFAPKRWTGQLRRNLFAKALQGSNNIEGYDVNEDDAVAAVDDQEPLDADARTWAEILGYRTAMSYVLQLADDSHFTYDASLLRSLHYMLLSHDLAKSPGRYRQGPIFVNDERTNTAVYEGPPADLAANLVEQLMLRLREHDDLPVYVRAAMAHLNLVMIHPFRDGNGRMARCLQTLVLARDQVAAPVFSSIEEFLGANTDDYYKVLTVTADGSWQPRRDTTAWIRFTIRAHHIQAQTVAARNHEAAELWSALEALADTRGLPERAIGALFDAASGLRIRRPGYERLSGVEGKSASRDLNALVDAGLLSAHGETRGRFYRGTDQLLALRRESRHSRPAIRDPYLDFPSWLQHQASQLAGTRHAEDQLTLE